jgi:hypothetical protein
MWGVLGVQGGDKMTPSTALRLLHSSTSSLLLPPSYLHHHRPNFTDINQKRYRYLTTPHTPTTIMFRRVATAVPVQAGRVLSTVARPNIASHVRTSAPTLASAGRRQYHEKDKSCLCAMSVLGEMVATERIPSGTLDRA